MLYMHNVIRKRFSKHVTEFGDVFHVFYLQVETSL